MRPQHPAPHAHRPSRHPTRARRARGPARGVRNPAVRANVLVFFLYTGIEASAGQWTYTLLTESRGLGAQDGGARRLALLGQHLRRPPRLRRPRAPRRPAAAAAADDRGRAAARARAMAVPRAGRGVRHAVRAGPVLAPIFPLLIAETPARVGERHAAHAIGFQVAAATLGAGTLPALAGVLMRAGGPRGAVPVPAGRHAAPAARRSRSPRVGHAARPARRPARDRPRARGSTAPPSSPGRGSRASARRAGRRARTCRSPRRRRE